MLTQAEDYRAECEVLAELLDGIGTSWWNEPTQFKSWTFREVLGHLHMFDWAARLTLVDPVSFRTFIDGAQKTLSGGQSMRDLTRTWLGDLEGLDLLIRWRRCYREVANLYADADPAGRVAWVGPDMSTRSCISARQMETWSHGQELFDALGRERCETDRIKNIAIMGINTFAWCFTNRSLEVPRVKPYVRLSAPSGELWEWNDAREVQRIEGSAVDFCRVVTQTRNLADTSLAVTGEIARSWMLNAQCFAGPAQIPPAPGSRFREARIRDALTLSK